MLLKTYTHSHSFKSILHAKKNFYKFEFYDNNKYNIFDNMLIAYFTFFK